MCQHMEELHELVNQYFLKGWCYKSCMGKCPFKVQDRPTDFNVTEHDEFIDV